MNEQRLKTEKNLKGGAGGRDSLPLFYVRGLSPDTLPQTLKTLCQNA